MGSSHWGLQRRVASSRPFRTGANRRQQGRWVGAKEQSGRTLVFSLTELSETMMGDEDHPHQRSRSPPPHHLLPPPPPPPPTVTSGTNRHFVGRDFSTPPSHHAHHLHHGHHQTSLSMLNRSSSPAHDLGYHTLVARGSTPASAAPCWSPTEF